MRPAHPGKLTSKQKQLIIELMLPGHFLLMGDPELFGGKGVKIYAEDFTSKLYSKEKDLTPFLHILKRDRKKRYTLNLSLVRRFDGRSFIKKLYRLRRKAIADQPEIIVEEIKPAAIQYSLFEL